MLSYNYTAIEMVGLAISSDDSFIVYVVSGIPAHSIQVWV